MSRKFDMTQATYQPQELLARACADVLEAILRKSYEGDDANSIKEAPKNTKETQVDDTSSLVLDLLQTTQQFPLSEFGSSSSSDEDTKANGNTRSRNDCPAVSVGVKELKFCDDANLIQMLQQSDFFNKWYMIKMIQSSNYFHATEHNHIHNPENDPTPAKGPAHNPQIQTFDKSNDSPSNSEQDCSKLKTDDPEILNKDKTPVDLQTKIKIDHMTEDPECNWQINKSSADDAQMNVKPQTDEDRTYLEQILQDLQNNYEIDHKTHDPKCNFPANKDSPDDPQINEKPDTIEDLTYLHSVLLDLQNNLNRLDHKTHDPKCNFQVNTSSTDGPQTNLKADTMEGLTYLHSVLLDLQNNLNGLGPVSHDLKCNSQNRNSSVDGPHVNLKTQTIKDMQPFCGALLKDIYSKTKLNQDFKPLNDVLLNLQTKPEFGNTTLYNSLNSQNSIDDGQSNLKTDAIEDLKPFCGVLLKDLYSNTKLNQDCKPLGGVLLDHQTKPELDNSTHDHEGTIQITKDGVDGSHINITKHIIKDFLPLDGALPKTTQIKTDLEHTTKDFNSQIPTISKDAAQVDIEPHTIEGNKLPDDVLFKSDQTKTELDHTNCHPEYNSQSNAPQQSHVHAKPSSIKDLFSKTKLEHMNLDLKYKIENKTNFASDRVLLEDLHTKAEVRQATQNPEPNFQITKNSEKAPPINKEVHTIQDLIHVHCATLEDLQTKIKLHDLHHNPEFNSQIKINSADAPQVAMETSTSKDYKPLDSNLLEDLQSTTNLDCITQDPKFNPKRNSNLVDDPQFNVKRRKIDSLKPLEGVLRKHLHTKCDYSDETGSNLLPTRNGSKIQDWTTTIKNGAALDNILLKNYKPNIDSVVAAARTILGDSSSINNDYQDVSDSNSRTVFLSNSGVKTTNPDDGAIKTKADTSLNDVLLKDLQTNVDLDQYGLKHMSDLVDGSQENNNGLLNSHSLNNPHLVSSDSAFPDYTDHDILQPIAGVSEMMNPNEQNSQFTSASAQLHIYNDIKDRLLQQTELDVYRTPIHQILQQIQQNISDVRHAALANHLLHETRYNDNQQLYQDDQEEFLANMNPTQRYFNLHPYRYGVDRLHRYTQSLQAGRADDMERTNEVIYLRPSRTGLLGRVPNNFGVMLNYLHGQGDTDHIENLGRSIFYNDLPAEPNRVVVKIEISPYAKVIAFLMALSTAMIFKLAVGDELVNLLL